MKPEVEDSPYVPDVEEAVAKATDGLKRNNRELIGEKKSLQAKLKAFEAIDLDAYHAAQEKLAALGDLDIEQARAALAERDGYAAKEAALTADYTAGVAERDTKIGQLTSTLAQKTVSSALALALAGKTETPSVVMPYAEKFVKARETEGGEWELAYFDEAGVERKNYSMDKFVAHLSTQFPSAFLGTGSSGGGSQRSTNYGGGSRRTIQSGDNRSFIANLDAIADGEIEVR
jgi:hypothetical protein